MSPSGVGGTPPHLTPGAYASVETGRGLPVRESLVWLFTLWLYATGKVFFFVGVGCVSAGGYVWMYVSSNGVFNACVRGYYHRIVSHRIAPHSWRPRLASFAQALGLGASHRCATRLLVRTQHRALPFLPRTRSRTRSHTRLSIPRGQARSRQATAGVDGVSDL
jgi:hypothetical protein